MSVFGRHSLRIRVKCAPVKSFYFKGLFSPLATLQPIPLLLQEPEHPTPYTTNVNMQIGRGGLRWRARVEMGLSLRQSGS